MEESEKIVILDFEKGEVFVYNYDRNIDTPESLLERLEHNENMCQYMIVDKLKINF